MTENGLETNVDDITNQSNSIPNSGVSIKEERLGSIMDAASALNSLGDENETHVADVVDPEPESAQITEKDAKISPSDDNGAEILIKTTEGTLAEEMKPNNHGIRYIPDHKKADAAPTFPEKMMSLMRLVDKHKDDVNFCAAWQPDGKSFIVRNPDEFARKIVPQFFKATKFSSFTRKLYRWGFRQVNRGIGPDDPVIFGNEFFERDNEALMSKMRSITAAGTRKTETRTSTNQTFGKRPYDGNMFDSAADHQKRFLYEQFMQQHKNSQMMHQSPSLYGGVNANNSMPINHMMPRPNGNTMEHPYYQNMMTMNKFEMMPQQGSPQHPQMMNSPFNQMHHHHHHYQQSPHHYPQQHYQHQQALAGVGGNNMVQPVPSVSEGVPHMVHPGMQSMGGGPAPEQPQGMANTPSSEHYQSMGQSPTGIPGQNPAYAGGNNNINNNNQNTAEIVNAAIRALQYSS